MNIAIPGMTAIDSPERIEKLRQELCKMPQYEPITRHYFHGGMYCREVWRQAGVALVGAVHKKEHFYVIVSGTVVINGGQRITGPMVLCCEPGTQRAVFSETDVLCMTFHKTDARTVEEAEAELIEATVSMYGPGNTLKALS